MNGTLLRFYVHESRKHHHIALFEWLLNEAKALGIRGGSALRAIAGAEPRPWTRRTMNALSTAA